MTEAAQNRPGDFESRRLRDRTWASARHLRAALILIVAFMAAEVAGGLLSGSLALLADAGHMLTDVASIGLALSAFWLGGRSAPNELSFGFRRAEVLAAGLNTVGLWAIAGWIFYTAAKRFSAPPEIDAILVLGVGGAGLAVNLAAAWILHRSRGESLNVEGAFLHVLADTLGSVGVIVSGALILGLGWTAADPVVAIVIGVLILIASARLVREVGQVLMQGAPANVNMGRLCQQLESVSGVQDIHDIHAWSITSGYHVLSAHAVLNDDGARDAQDTLRQIREIALTRFGIAHTTVQLEDESTACEESHHPVHE